MVYIFCLLVYKCHNNEDSRGRTSFFVVGTVIIADTDWRKKILRYTLSLSYLYSPYSSYSYYLCTSLYFSTNSLEIFLLIILQLRRQWWSLNKYSSHILQLDGGHTLYTHKESLNPVATSSWCDHCWWGKDWCTSLSSIWSVPSEVEHMPSTPL